MVEDDHAETLTIVQRSDKASIIMFLYPARYAETILHPFGNAEGMHFFSP
jgi:hypothetical protein